LSPVALVVDGQGNLYVANSTGMWNGQQWAYTVSKFAPGSTTPTATLTGLNQPRALAVDGSGNLFVVNAGNNTVSKFAPGATTPMATLTGLYQPWALAVDGSGNLFVLNTASDGSKNIVSEFAPGATMPTATLTGVNGPGALVFDGNGNLYASNGMAVSMFAPGSTSPNGTLTGATPGPLAVDASGNLYATRGFGIQKFTPTTSGVVIRSSLPTRPMSLGETKNVVAGINLSDAELAAIQTAASGTVTVGDSAQTGNITFTNATVATTAGASTVVMQAASGPGQIILDDAGTCTGLDGNGGTVSLSPGTGGIAAPMSSASGVPLATNGFNATGLPLTPTLSFAPTVGTQLTLVNNTATPAAGNPIVGTFANLPPGGIVTLTYAGTPYKFRVNYAGGDGNDLVLTCVVASPAVTISQVPPFGQAGNLAGTVSGVDFATYRVAVYIQIEGAGWWTKPTFAAPTVLIAPDGTFWANVVSGGLDAYATIYCAAVVPDSYTPPAASGSPGIPAGLVSEAIVFRDRYTTGPTVQFAGLTWAEKDAPLPVGPGSNPFSTQPNDIWADAQGLHLSVHQHDGSWWSTEAILTQSLGYGTYVFQTASRLDALDANATFGAFTWDPYGDSPSPGGGPNREIDVEASRWGNPLDPLNAQYVVQPYNAAGHLHRFTTPDLSADPAVTWFVRWAPENVEYTAVRGSYPTGGDPEDAVIQQWVYQDVVPPPGRETFHFNLWLNSPAPAGGQPLDVVVNDFRFLPPQPPPTTAPTILGLANDTGQSATDQMTNNPTLRLSGVDSGNWVQYSFDSLHQNWSASPTPPADGPVSVEVRQLDVVGNAGPASAPFNYTYDTTAPVVLSAVPSRTMIEAGNAGPMDPYQHPNQGLAVRVYFSEPMNQGWIYQPMVTFSPDVIASGTLTLDTNWSFWINSTTYVAAFDVAVPPSGFVFNAVGIHVSLSQDFAGNTQTPHLGTNDFDINTLNTPAHVTGVTPSVTTVTKTNLGPSNTVGVPDGTPGQGFVVRVFYDAPMNTASKPTVSFVQNVASTLTADSTWGFWIGPTTYYAGFDVAPSSLNVQGIQVTVSGGIDAAHSDLPARYVSTNTFNIDMVDPAPTPEHVTSVTPNLTLVSTLNEGADKFQVRLTYDSPMRDWAGSPRITLTPANPSQQTDLNNSLSLDLTTSGWISNTIFVANYNVPVSSVNIPQIGVTVTGALDLTGNPQAPANFLNVFSLDTFDQAPPPATDKATTNLAMVTTANQGTDKFVVNVTYSTQMNENSRPVITFLPDVNGYPVGGLIQLDYGVWTGPYTYAAAYNVTNVAITNPDVGIRVTGALDLIGNPQTTSNDADVFEVNTLTPLSGLANVASVVPSVTLVTPRNLGPGNTVGVPDGTPEQGFWVDITFDRSMHGNWPTVSLTPTDPDPTGSLAAAINSTLTFDPNWSFFYDLNHTVFRAAFDVSPSGVDLLPLTGITVNIKAARDLVNNVDQMRYSGPAGFNIDTLDPPAARALVSSITTNLTLVSQTNAPPASQPAFTVRVAYNEPMRQNIPPTITFSQDVSSALTLDPAWSFWISNMLYVASYDVSDASPITRSGVGINVSKALDLMGYRQAVYTGPTSGPGSFNVDTTQPAPVTSVTSATPNLTLVTQANVGSHTFFEDIIYSGQMRMVGAPTITFSPNVSTTLQPNANYTGWVNNHDYRAAYNVLSTLNVFSSITITVTGGIDVIGNPAAPYTNQPAGFTIDMTQSGAVVASSAVVSSAVASPAVASSAVASPAAASLADAVLSSGALNLSVGSLAASTNNQRSAIDPIDQALALTGTWLDI
jgi:hypothetical protein